LKQYKVKIATPLSSEQAIKVLKKNSVKNYFQVKNEDLVGKEISKDKKEFHE